MKVTALISPPLSGSITEHWFEERGGDTWFRFETDFGVEWAGLFASAGLVPETCAVDFADGGTVLINAGGSGYVVGVDSAKLIYRPAVVPLVGAIRVPGRDLIIARDFTKVYALGREGELWKSPRIASDGVEFRHSTSNTLFGRAFRWTAWHDFTLSYDGWLLSIGALPE